MMGKKLKLQDAPPPDVFDKLQLESHQAPTAVLLLDSPEDDVVIKAADAIYRFSEKCDENKITLLAIESILEKLLALLHSDEPLIRKTSCMAFASLSRHVDARKYLRKIPQTIPYVVQLMAHDDNSVVHEYGALCLSSLALDYTAKIAITSSGGLTQLVKCLASDDPDVVKNSMEAIALTLQDYEAKSAFREIPDAISSVIEHLESEYSVIKYQALLTLTSLAQNGYNRSILCDLGIVSWIMQFLTKPDHKDLQVFAVILLVNCLEDPNILKAFKEAGGLHILVGLITDKSAVTAEEDKGKEKETKGKKEKSSKADGGRKSRNVDEDESRQKNRTAADPEITTLPDLKEHVCRALAYCASEAGCRKILHELDVEKKLVSILVATDRSPPSAQWSAVFTLGVLSEFEPSRQLIGKLDAVESMTKLVAKRDNVDAMEAVSLAFANLTINNPHNCNEIMKFGGLDLLLALIQEPRELTASSAATAIANMSPNEQVRSEFLRMRGVTVVVGIAAKTRSTLVQSRCLWALSSLVADASARAQFVEVSGLEMLTKTLPSGDLVVVKNASWLLAMLASADKSLADNLCQLGCLEILRQIQNSATRRNALSQVALSKLFNSQLTAKYSFTGSLDATDITTDGFYDPGQLKIKDSLKSLDDYGLEPINDRRPIIVVNPRPEIAAVSVSPLGVADGELIERSSHAVSGTGRSSRSGRDTKTKRLQKDRDADKQREEEQLLQLSLQREAERLAAEAAAKQAQVYIVPPDPVLLQYIDDVTEHIKTLPSSKEQAVALARFVSDKMGGPMTNERLASWRTDLQKIKEKLKSNVIPLGLITNGFYCHRALCFKVLADRIGLLTTLVRSDYDRAWNCVTIASLEVTSTPAGCQQPKSYIVDVIHQPGELLEINSYDALAYMRSQTW